MPIKTPTTASYVVGAIPEYLLVDGSNVIHAWPELRALLKRDKAGAKDRLSTQLLALLPTEFARVTVVFDGRGGELVVEHPAGPDSLAVIHTPAGLTADDIIEKLVGSSSGPGSCMVCTGDQTERATIEASGAVWCSPQDLAARLEQAGNRQSGKLTRLRKDNHEQWKRRA